MNDFKDNREYFKELNEKFDDVLPEVNYLRKKVTFAIVAHSEPSGGAISLGELMEEIAVAISGFVAGLPAEAREEFVEDLGKKMLSVFEAVDTGKLSRPGIKFEKIGTIN